MTGPTEPSVLLAIFVVQFNTPRTGACDIRGQDLILARHSLLIGRPSSTEVAQDFAKQESLKSSPLLVSESTGTVNTT